MPRTYLLVAVSLLSFAMTAVGAETRPGGSGVSIHAADQPIEQTIVRDGRAVLPLVVGSVEAPAELLREHIRLMSGVQMRRIEARHARRGVFVGLVKDFPHADIDDAASLGDEGFVIRTDARGVYLLAHKPLGVQHAVVTLLQRLGCRWFFPGPVWRVMPKHETIAGAWNERQVPDFKMQRRIWAGYGLYKPNRDDWEVWERFNRMGGPVDISIHHSWYGLNPDRDFQQHPEWFALVDGKRQPTKPCYSHPEVTHRAIEYALKRAAEGAKMIPMSAPDGLGYCECRKCLSVLKGGEPFEQHFATYGRRPDGKLVNVTSETLFAMVNRVAEAVSDEYPDVRLGCYAYSAYSHPPSFRLHPNVYVQITTHYRRTSLTLQQQLDAFSLATDSLGVREYYSVYQWDWDRPDPQQVRPDRLRQTLRFFERNAVEAINAEASNNWGPRGLGYYIAANLMWDVDADVPGLIRDFYEKAFGPAAEPMQQYYARWYGPVTRVLGEEAATPTDDVADYEPPKLDRDTLCACFANLDEAVRLTADRPDCRATVDHLRMYLHYLVLRRRLEDAAGTNDLEAVLEAIREETMFGGRLNRTNMIHTRPLIGKAFARRFHKYADALARLPADNPEAKQWRGLDDPPRPDVLQRLWNADKAYLDLPSAARPQPKEEDSEVVNHLETACTMGLRARRIQSIYDFSTGSEAHRTHTSSTKERNPCRKQEQPMRRRGETS